MNDTYNCNIIKDDSIRSSKNGTLEGVTYDDLVVTLGLPNIKDDPAKVTWSWGFRVNPSSVPMAIWDYKGSADYNSWSIDGPLEVWAELFPEATITTL